jgi:hypothetical protein
LAAALGLPHSAIQHKTPGKYFPDVRAANIDSWTVKIEEKK